MSYHNISIAKHHFNSPFKILEEFQEYLDALSQDNRILAIQELADLYGAIKIQANILGFNMDEVVKMSNLTTKVFLDGTRNPNIESTSDYFIAIKEFNATDSIKIEHYSIIELLEGTVSINNQNPLPSTKKIFNVYTDDIIIFNKKTTLKIYRVR